MTKGSSDEIAKDIEFDLACALGYILRDIKDHANPTGDGFLSGRDGV